MKDGNAVFSTGELKNTPLDKLAGIMLDAAQGAAEKNKVTEAKVMETGIDIKKALADINALEIPNADTTTAKREAQDNKMLAQSAGEKLAEIQEEIEKWQNDPDFKLSSIAGKNLERLHAAKKTIMGYLSTDELRKHAEASKLHAEIRLADPTNRGKVKEMLNAIVRGGVSHIATAKEIEDGRKNGWPKNTHFFEGVTYITNGDTSYQRGVHSEIHKILNTYKCSRASSIEEKGSADLKDFEAGKLGAYYMYSPKRTEGDRKFGEGHALVEIRDANKGKQGKNPYVVVEVRDASGSLARLLGKKAIPFFWVKEGRVITRSENRPSDQDFADAKSIIGTLRALVRVWEESQKPAPVPKTDSAEPAYTAVGEADMTGVVVERRVTPTTDAPLLPAPETSTLEKKPRKVKKTLVVEKAE